MFARMHHLLIRGSTGQLGRVSSPPRHGCKGGDILTGERMEARNVFCAGMHEAREPCLTELTPIFSLLNIVSQVVFAQYSLGVVAFITVNDCGWGEVDPGG